MTVTMTVIMMVAPIRIKRNFYSGALLFEKKVIFAVFLKTRNGPTDRPTDGPTDQRTDKPSYRDARTHLKTPLAVSEMSRAGGDADRRQRRIRTSPICLISKRSIMSRLYL